MSDWIRFDRSPHQSSRDGMDISCVVIHTTGAQSFAGSIAWAKDPTSKASWHFIVDRDGTAVQQVELEHAAWHSGQSEAPYKGLPTQNVNRFSIGIELANMGLLDPRQPPVKGFAPAAGSVIINPAKHGDKPVAVTGLWEPFPEAQLVGLDKLLQKLRTMGYAQACDTLYGHHEVARPIGRKSDPGAAFVWGRYRTVDPGLSVSTLDSTHVA